MVPAEVLLEATETDCVLTERIVALNFMVAQGGELTKPGVTLSKDYEDGHRNFA